MCIFIYARAEFYEVTCLVTASLPDNGPYRTETFTTLIIRTNILSVDRDSSVGIATRQGLDAPGIELRRGEFFRTRPDGPWGPPSLLYKGYRVSSAGLKRPVRGVDQSPPCSAEVNKRV